MTKAITCTVIGRLIHEGWLALGLRPGAGAAVARPARDPPPDHDRPSAAHALGARLSGVGTATAASTIGFENSAVYQDAGDAYEAAQRSIVATVPGAVYPLHQCRAQRARLGHPRPDREARPAVSPDALRPADRSARHGELSAFGRHRRQSDRARAPGSRICATTPSSACCTCRTGCGTASGCCRRAGPITR